MNAITSQITNLMTVFSIIYLGADQRKHESSASPVTGEFPAQKPVKRKMFSFDDVIMNSKYRIECE